MRKEDIDRLVRARPFKPFEVRLVDGRRFRFKSPEQLLVGRSALVTLDAKGDWFFINIGLIATAQQGNGHGRRSRRG